MPLFLGLSGDNSKYLHDKAKAFTVFLAFVSIRVAAL